MVLLLWCHLCCGVPVADVEVRMMRDTLAGQMWPCERICGWLWRLWVPQLYGSAVSEVVVKGKISGQVVEELGKGASLLCMDSWYVS